MQNACSFLTCHHNPGHILPAWLCILRNWVTALTVEGPGGLHSGYSSMQLWASACSLGTWSTQACRCFFLSDSQATGVTQSPSIRTVSCSNLEPVCSLVWGHELLRRFVNKRPQLLPLREGRGGQNLPACELRVPVENQPQGWQWRGGGWGTHGFYYEMISSCVSRRMESVSYANFSLSSAAGDMSIPSAQGFREFQVELIKIRQGNQDELPQPLFSWPAVSSEWRAA